MKRQFLLFLLLLSSWLGLNTAQAQTTIARESFESATATTPANSTSSFGYTSFDQNYFDDRANTVQFFQRSSLPVAGFNTANGFVFGTGIDGSWLVAGEAVRGQVGGSPDRAARYVQLNGINIAGKNSIQVLVSFADGRGLGSGATIGQGTNNWENDDFVRIKARVNGGAWTVIGQLVGDNPGGSAGGRLRQDTNFTGTSYDAADASSPAVSSSFQDFTFNLTGSGSTLDVMVEVDANGGSEELALDNIRVLGTASATAPPVLANIETTSLNYNEGNQPTQITSAVTVSDADSPNLTGGSVSLTTGFVSAQDRLLFTNQNGITGSYSLSSGVLTLAGTASLAAYQAALRSVQYQNIETVTAIGGLRLATFTVTDGTATSAVSRNIIVNAQLNAPAALPYTEDFETNGEGLRYASNTWSTSNPCLGFLRTNANPYACTPTTFGGISGSYYWYSEGTTNGANPNPIDIGTLVLAPVNATNIGSLHFNVKLGIGEGTPAGLQWEIDDYVKFFYRVNGGNWVLFGAYVGDGPTTATSGNLRRDADLNGVADPGGTILTTTLQNTDFALPTSVTGASVDFMIEVSSDGQEELAMDRIVVTGTPATTVNSLVRASANPTNAATVNYTVTFGAPVTGLTAANFTLTTSGLSGATVGTPVSTGTGSTWTVPVNTGTGNGTLTLNLANDTNLSTDITNTLPFAGETYTIDKAAPTVSSVAVPANGTYRTGQALSFTVNFSEAVTVTGTPQLGLTLDTGGSVPANYVSGSGTAALVFSYTIVAGNADGNGIAVGTLALNGGTVRDAATNNATLTLNGVPATTGVLVDGIAPVVSSINRQTPTATTTNAASLTYRVTFSEAVTGVTANDFSLTNTGTANGTISAVAAVSTSVYDVAVNSVSGTGTVRLDLNSSGTSIMDTPAGNAIGGGYTSGQPYTLDPTAPTATLSSTMGASGTTTTTTPFSFTVTFSEAVAGFATSGITVTNGSVTSGPAGTSPGTTFTFTVTPTTAGTATTVAIAANAAQDAAGNGNTVSSTYSLTYNLPTATVTGINKLAPTAAQSATGTATASVSFTVTFSASVSGVSISNFNLTTSAGITGAGVTSVVGSGASYTVTVNTGTGNGTLQLNVASAGGITPSVTNTPFNGTSAVYTVTKSFAASPQLTIQGTGGTGSDVTAFIDQVQVLNGGTAVANALQNSSFETHNPLANGNFGYTPTGASWTFNAQSGIAESGSAFTPTTPIPNGIAVAFVQSNITNGQRLNGQLQQSLAVPTGSYQVNFQAAQRICCTTLDQSLNVFINGVFIGTIQPNSNGYTAFTSTTFSVAAPDLTATISTTAASPTNTSPIPFSVGFSQSVGTTFTASDVTVTGGTLTSGSFSGSGSGPYTFTVTPSASGTVTVSLAANVASDANNTGNSASNSVSVQYQQPVTAAPVVLTPNGFVSTGFPTYSGTAVAGSTVTVYVNNASIGTTTATGTGTWNLTQPTRLADGAYTVYATAQSSGNAVSANSNTNTFVIDTVSPTVAISSSAAPNGGTSSTSPLAYTVTFSETVTGFVAGDVTVGNGTLSGFAGSGTTYTFNVTPSANGTVTVDVPANVAQDRASNGNNAASQYRIAYAQLVTATPVLTAPANGSLLNTTAPTYSGTAPAGATVTIYVDNAAIGTTTATGGTFSLIQPTALAQGSHTVYATAQTSGSAVSANSSTITFTVDTVSPTVAISSSVGASGGSTSTSPIPFTVTFSEGVTGFVAGDVTVTNGTISGFVGSGTTYTFNVTPTTAGTATTVSIPTNVTQDAASNFNTAATPFSLTYLAPTIVIAPVSLPGGTVATAYSATFSASGGTAPYIYAVTSGALPTGLTLTSAGVLSGTPTASGTFTFTVTATDASAAPGPYSGARTYTLAIGSQAVTAAPVVLTPANGFVSTRFPTYSGTAVANSTVTVIVDGTSIGTTTTDGSGNWRLTASSPLAEGSHIVRATAQASGQAVSASSNTNTFVVDTISPSVTISSSTAPSGSTSSSSPFAYTVTFSESVTGFVAGDVTVGNGTVSGFAGSGTTYSFSVTPAANGVVTVDVPVNVAQDAAGNGNNAATQYAITYQQLVTAAPVVTTPANGALVSTTTPTYSGTAQAGTTVTVFVDNLSLGTTTATGGNWTLVQPTALAQGTHTVRATAQLSGQTVSASSSTNTFSVDTVSPTITLGSTATNPTTTSPIPVTATFSESVTGFGASSVTVTNGTLAGFAGSGSLYTFSVTPSAAGTVTVNIAANVAQDAAGNGNVAAPQFSITYVVPVTATTWTGNISTDWFTAGNWTAGVPTATVDATIPAGRPNFPLVAAGTATAKNMSITSGASLSQSGGTLSVRGNLTNNGTFGPTGGTVALGTTTQANILGSSTIRFWNLSVQTNGVQLSTSAGASVQRVLTLTGSLTTNGNTFTLLSSGTGDALVVNSGGVVAGTATVQRYIDPSLNAGLGARHYSAPVSNTTVADLATSGYTPVLNPAFNTADKPAQVRPFPTVFGYDQSRLTLVNTLPTFDKGFFSPTSFSDPLRVGQGYVVNIASTELVDFVGTLNNGDVTTTMASNRDTYANDGGWQLVGNPYPAPLDYDRVVVADRAGLDASLYVYSSTSQYYGQYRAYVRGIGGNSVVSSGQGFFVRVSSGQTTGSLTLRNTYRLTAPNSTTFQRTTAETRPLVQLTLKGTGSPSDDAYVYFENGATNALDAQFDAVKLPNTTGLNLSTSISGQQLAIDGRPELGKAQQVVPLNVGVPTVGTYTFTTAQLLNLANVPVYLRDLQLGTVTDLRLTPSYQFTVTNAAALITGRFELVFSPQQALATVPAALAQQVALYPNPARKAAFVELPASLGRQAVMATFVDALGRQVRTVQLPAQGSVAHPLDLSDLATGVYALRLSTSAGVVVKKLVVE